MANVSMSPTTMQKQTDSAQVERGNAQLKKKAILLKDVKQSTDTTHEPDEEIHTKHLHLTTRTAKLMTIVPVLPKMWLHVRQWQYHSLQHEKYQK